MVKLENFYLEKKILFFCISKLINYEILFYLRNYNYILLYVFN